MLCGALVLTPSICIWFDPKGPGVPARQAENGKMPRSVVDATIFAAAAADKLEASPMQIDGCALGNGKYLSQRQ